MLHEFKMLDDLRLAHALVEQHHYSGRAVRGSSFAAGAFQGEELQGACFFSSPAARWPVVVLELCRLVKVPGSDFPLSGLVSYAVRQLRQQPKALLVSYADATQDHHGGIYQACSWNYHGLRSPRVDGFYLDGVFTPKRSCNTAYGTCGLPQLRELFASVVPHYDSGKHLYWKALNKRGERDAMAAKLHKCAYPKPRILAEALS